ncbi:MAG: hypothetical protein ACP5GU_06845 [Thermoprotei archaeon]
MLLIRNLWFNNDTIYLNPNAIQLPIFLRSILIGKYTTTVDYLCTILIFKV